MRRVGTDELLEAKIEDLAEQAERRGSAVSDFWNLAEQYRAKAYLRSTGRAGQTLFTGGYADAERKRLVLAPTYLADLVADMAENTEEKTHTAALEEVMREVLSDAVTPLRVQGSGYHVLSHRDYLGAVLGLGIDRSVLGDIAVLSEKEAILFCASHMADFLCETLDKIGADHVTCEKAVLSPDFSCPRNVIVFERTVASERLDAVLAALLDVSRDDAKEIVSRREAELNFSPAEKPEMTVSPGDMLSVRGYGRFEICKLSDADRTRRGRMRLVAHKFI